MDMNKTFFLKKEKRDPRWRLIDAQGQVVGRLATQIADLLRGKNTPHYTPHIDSGDYVVVINSDKIVFTGNKLEDKVYERYTGYIGNKKFLTAQQMLDKDSTQILTLAVRGMLPKNKLSRALLNKLKVFKGAEHTHAAQLAGYGIEK